MRGRPPLARSARSEGLPPPSDPALTRGATFSRKGRGIRAGVATRCCYPLIAAISASP